MDDDWIIPEIMSLRAIAVAELDEKGILIKANTGFLKLIEVEGGTSQIGMRAGHFFIQPNFSFLINAQADCKGQVYKGILTIGDYADHGRSLIARVWRIGKGLRILAEYDIEELEKIYRSLVELNSDYAKAQLELAHLNQKIQLNQKKALALSLTDPLTGIGNRRKLDQVLELEIGRAERTGDKLSVLMTDLDHFKHINDTYGHIVGDKVITVHVQMIQQRTRPTDIITRFGGEELVILMPHTNIQNAYTIAERIRFEFANCQIEPLEKAVTVSIGVVELAKNEQAESLLHRVDKALYEAKNAGRNRVIVAH
jgi:two-component system, cell cycle response regulator